MPPTTIAADAIDSLDVVTVRAACAAFARAGFDAAFVGRAEEIAPRQFDQIRLPVVRWWLRRRGGAAATLARLFAYGDTATPGEVEGALPAAVVRAFRDTGVLVAKGGAVSSAVRVIPFEGLWLASDEMDAAGDPVMGPGATTARLASALRVEPGSTVLDIGCGAGTLALVAKARGASVVVGVDLLERAVAWSRFNARMNGLEATFVAGDLTAPVAGRRFDLVVSQPPFVIQPGESEATTYLHGGRLGDEIALRLLGEVDAVLAPRGRALVFYDAPCLPGRTLEERLRGALGGAATRTLAVTAPGHDADAQAIAYSAVRAPDLGAEYRGAVVRVREHLAALGVERGRHVLVEVVGARPGEAPLIAVAEVPSLRGWDAAALASARAALEVATSDDETLLAAKIRVAPDAVRVEETSLGERQIRRVRVRFESERNDEFELSDAAAVLVDIVHREPRVRRVVGELARAARARPEEVRDRTLSFVRQALLAGLFVPAKREGGDHHR